MELIIAFVLALGTIASWFVLPSGDGMPVAEAPAGASPASA